MKQLHRESSVPWLDSPLFPNIQCYLKKPPEKRYQTFEELREYLEPLLQQLTREVVNPPQMKVLETWKWDNKGNRLANVSRYEGTIHCYNKTLELDPRYAAVRINKAVTEDYLGHAREATLSYQNYLSLAPAQDSKQIELARKHLQDLEGK
jgi:tetratricopeptide (TPR) repeat protein